jgi:hypothetical protein
MILWFTAVGQIEADLIGAMDIETLKSVDEFRAEVKMAIPFSVLEITAISELPSEPEKGPFYQCNGQKTALHPPTTRRPLQVRHKRCKAVIVPFERQIRKISISCLCSGSNASLSEFIDRKDI